MDNPNDPNSSNNLNPNPTTPSFGATPTPLPDLGTPPASAQLPSSPTSALPSTPPTPPPIPEPAMPETGPVPTFTQTTSPLDNPLGAPQQSQPTWVPPSPMSNATTTNQTLSDPPIPAAQPTPPPPETGSAPTDLSHLISNNSQGNSGQNPSSSPETLVVPPQASNPVPEVPTVPTQGHKGIPKWLIGVAVGLLIVVAGTSAYFILGIGQPKQTTTSAPAEVSKPTVKAPPPIATPVPQPTAPAATGSANFGQLEGSGTQQATSAADLLKQRQQEGI